MEELRIETEKNSQYIKKCDYHLVEMWECQWKQMQRQHTEIKEFSQQFRKPLDFKQTISESDMLNAVKTKKLFGMVECDIHVPNYLRYYFAEMTPIF